MWHVCIHLLVLVLFLVLCLGENFLKHCYYDSLLFSRMQEWFCNVVSVSIVDEVADEVAVIVCSLLLSHVQIIQTTHNLFLCPVSPAWLWLVFVADLLLLLVTYTGCRICALKTCLPLCLSSYWTSFSFHQISKSLAPCQQLAQCARHILPRLVQCARRILPQLAQCAKWTLPWLAQQVRWTLSIRILSSHQCHVQSKYLCLSCWYMCQM